MKDEEQEWDPAAAEFMARRSRIFQTEAGNDTVGISKRYDDGEDNDAGSEISLLPLYNKGIYAESLFLNFDRPRDGVSVAAQIMAGQARVSGQEWDPDAAEFMARRLRIFQTEYGNTTVGISKQHGDGEDNDAGSEISLLLLYDKGIYADGLFLNLDRLRGGVPVAAEIMAGRARVSGRGSYRGHSGWNPRSELAFAFRMGTTAESGVCKGGLVKTIPPHQD